MNMKLIKPRKIIKGDTIGIVAPSAGSANIFPHRIMNAVKMINSMGYEVKFAKHSLERIDYVSASPKKIGRYPFH